MHQRTKVSVTLLVGFFHGYAWAAETPAWCSREAIVPPAVNTRLTLGESLIDATFGNRITKLTDTGTAWIANSEIAYFNCDDSLFMASSPGGEGWIFETATGKPKYPVGRGSMRAAWCRWAVANYFAGGDRRLEFDPVFHFYKHEGNEIRLYDCRDVSYVVLRTFEEYKEIGSAGLEGDLSDDGRYWCLDGDGQELFVYDLIEDKKSPPSKFDLGERIGGAGFADSLDYATVTPTGEYVVCFWDTGNEVAPRHGIELYDHRNGWKRLRQLVPWDMHAELGFDAGGDEVLFTGVAYKFDDFYAKWNVKPGSLIQVRLRDGEVRLLLDVPKWAHFVMSANDLLAKPRCVYVAFTDRNYDPQEMWMPYWGEIIQIPLDGSGNVRRLAHHRSRRVKGRATRSAGAGRAGVRCRVDAGRCARRGGRDDLHPHR